MAGPSYKHFTDVYDIPYTVVTFLYIGAVLIFTLAVIITRLCESSCCSNRLCDWLSEQLEKFNSWLIRLIFGISEGVSEEKNKNDIHVNGHKLKTIDINILGTIILIFGLLVAINAYGAYLLEVTQTCSDDTNIYCFPLLLNINNSELELVVPDNALSEPIQDCADWTNSTIDPFVTFRCFRYALNADTALAIAGGLLALFTIVMRTTMSIIIKTFYKCNLYKHPKIYVVQIIVAFFLLILDIGAAIVVISFQLTASLGIVATEVDPVAQLIAVYIADNGIQLVVATGTIALLLLIPWTHYSKQPQQQQSPSALGQFELTQLSDEKKDPETGV